MTDNTNYDCAAPYDCDPLEPITNSNTRFTKNKANSYIVWKHGNFSFELNNLDDLISITVNAAGVNSIITINANWSVGTMFSFIDVDVDKSHQSIRETLDIDDNGTLCVGRNVECLPDYSFYGV